MTLLYVVVLSGCNWMGASYYNMSTEEWSSINPKVAGKLVRRATEMISDKDKLNHYDIDNAPDKIKVTLVGACRNIPYDKSSKFQKKQFVLSNGDCTRGLLTVKKGHIYCPIRLCYAFNALHLDMGRSQFSSTVSIPMMPLWYSSQEYNDIQTDGFTQLRNVKVKVEAV